MVYVLFHHFSGGTGPAVRGAVVTLVYPSVAVFGELSGEKHIPRSDPLLTPARRLQTYDQGAVERHLAAWVTSSD